MTDEEGILKKQLTLSKDKIHNKGLEHAIDFANKIEGFEEYGKEAIFLNIICPICSNRIKFPIHHTIEQLGKTLSIERKVKLPKDLPRSYGTFFDEYFLTSWNLLLKKYFGELEDLRKKDTYLSLPDFYNKTLKAYFEVKSKVALDHEDIERRFKGEVWIATVSVIKKFEQQQKNPEDLYIFVEYFLDEGYKVVECSKAYEYLKNNRVYVPLSEFISFNQFLNNRAEELKIPL